MKDYMFFLYVIFSPDKSYVRLEYYIWNLEITCFELSNAFNI